MGNSHGALSGYVGTRGYRAIIAFGLAGLFAALLYAASASGDAGSGDTGPMYVNVGGDAVEDGSGNAWQADQAYSQGSWGYVEHGRTGTADHGQYPVADDSGLNEVLTTERWGEFSYVFDLPDGDYELRLHVAETWDDEWGSIGSSGERVFEVTVNGEWLAEVDPHELAGGFASAYRLDSDVQTSGGQLDIRFHPLVESPAVKGIEVRPIEIEDSNGGGDESANEDGNENANEDEDNPAPEQGSEYPQPEGYTYDFWCEPADQETLDSIAQEWTVDGEEPFQYGGYMVDGYVSARVASAGHDFVATWWEEDGQWLSIPTTMADRVTDWPVLDAWDPKPHEWNQYPGLHSRLCVLEDQAPDYWR